jgi:hypothetical protein
MAIAASCAPSICTGDKISAPIDRPFEKWNLDGPIAFGSGPASPDGQTQFTLMFAKSITFAHFPAALAISVPN